MLLYLVWLIEDLCFKTVQLMFIVYKYELKYYPNTICMDGMK